MTEDQPIEVTVTVTCQTADCENSGIPITLTTVEGAQVVCGPCGEELVSEVQLESD